VTARYSLAALQVSGDAYLDGVSAVLGTEEPNWEALAPQQRNAAHEEGQRRGDAALAAAFSGGSVEFYDGERPPSPDDPVVGQRLLVRLRLATPAFDQPGADGMTRIRPVEPAPVLRTGLCHWFRALNAVGAVLAGGTVGLHSDEAADFHLAPGRTLRFNQGDEFHLHAFDLLRRE
jgi:hypothetical protein